MTLRDLYAMAVQVEITTKIKIYHSCSSFHYRQTVAPSEEFDGWGTTPNSFKNDKVLLFALEDNALIVVIK